jgi:adenine-specific DNA-methyltransferase
MKAIATIQKLRGGYYTPKPIADFLAHWAIQTPTAQVLEPSCGDGALLQASAKTLIELGTRKNALIHLLHSCEFDPIEARKASDSIDTLTGLTAAVSIHNGDFFAYCNTHLSDKHYFDAVIGNPPFIRYQNFPEEHRNSAFDLMQRAGLHPTRLSNAWVPFLVASTLLLKEDGRLAMVIPAELLQVNYASELRYFLSKYYRSIMLITFKKLVFEGIQQEVVLFLGERNGGAHSGIRTLELEDMSELSSYDHTALANTKAKEMDHSSEKWTMYFLAEEELQLLRTLQDHPGLTRSGHVIDVDVGIVTGMNEFFVLTEQQVTDHHLQPYTQHIVGRSAHLPGILFSETDWQNNTANQAATFLLKPPAAHFHDLPPELQAYIAYGEEKGWHTGYKCRIRKPWYSVPSPWIPQAFMLRQVHLFPKIILNATEATCTDTIHRVKLRNDIPGRTVATAFLNSLTFAFSEIMGRSYGGGVLELEPKEAEQLPLPLQGAANLDLDALDRLVRAGNIFAVLDITDKILLQEGMGLSRAETQQLRTIWEKLRDRRVNRKQTSSMRKSIP